MYPVGFACNRYLWCFMWSLTALYICKNIFSNASVCNYQRAVLFNLSILYLSNNSIVATGDHTRAYWSLRGQPVNYIFPIFSSLLYFSPNLQNPNAQEMIVIQWARRGTPKPPSPRHLPRRSGNRSSKSRKHHHHMT